MSDSPAASPAAPQADGAPAAPEQAPASSLDARSGLWIVVIAMGLLLGLVAWLYRFTQEQAPMAPLDVDLSSCKVDRDVLVVATTPDSLPPLVDQVTHGAAEAEALKLPEHGKNVVPSDRVIGVVIDGDARAYPIRIMNWHEVALDVVGGVPIAVTWSPLTETARVFDRRVDGETLDLVASGVVWNSNLVLLDRRTGGAPAAPGTSLWSQLLGRAITGPAAARGARLTPVRAQLVTWATWKAEHPATRVVSPDLSRAKLYKRDPYHSYVGSDVLRFPVRPMPPPEGSAPGALPRKTPVVVVGTHGKHVVYPLSAIAQRTDSARVWRTTQDGVPLVFRYYPAPANHASPPTAWVELPAGEATLEVIHTWWFAWFATHPDDARLVE